MCNLTNQVLELHRLDEIHCTSPRCSAIQSCLLDVSVRQCFLVFKLFSCEDQSLLFLTSKLDHFFTRASWATTVILSTITLYLITSRIECVTTFAQAFQRSDQTARCALHTTFRVAEQLLAFIAERYDRRCDAEKLRVLISLETCVFGSHLQTTC